MFGCERYDYLPDMITAAKGLTSGYSPLGAVICRDAIAEPFLSEKASFLHGITFGGHPVSCAVGLAQPRAVRGGRHPRRTSGRTRTSSATAIDGLRDIPIVGDVRGAGYFLALELVADPETDARFTKEAGRGAAARVPRAPCCSRRA